MFRRILVPLDGSERAERALPIAASLARASGGSIVLLRVIPSPIEFPYQATEAPTSTQEALDVNQARAANYFARITASEMLAGIATTTEVLRGIPVQLILSVARSQQIDIIIMCSHGYTGMSRRALGSVAEKVAFHAPTPVLVLRDGGSVLASPHPHVIPPLRALVALDGSARAEEAIEPTASFIGALASSTQGSLHLTQVVQSANAKSDERDLDESTDSIQKANRYLSSTADALQKGHLVPAIANLKLTVSWSVTLDDDVASALIRVAEHGEDTEGAGVSAGFDIIAMATHGFGSAERWTAGSITERVLKATKLPLLVVRPLDIMEKSNFTWDKADLSGI